MSEARAPLSMLERELRICLLANRAVHRMTAERFFAVISRLGDGMVWYVLMAALPLVYGPGALLASLHLGLTALAALGVYYTLKGLTKRPRPYRQERGIRLSVAPLDEFSFPSGHTLQAVAFTLVAVSWFPVLGWVLFPFAALVALSRVVLGLHYPSDVIAAIGLGSLLALVSTWLVSPWITTVS